MTEIEDVTKVLCSPEDKEQFTSILNVAAKNRSVAKTDMNAESSRSTPFYSPYGEKRKAKRSSSRSDESGRFGGQ